MLEANRQKLLANVQRRQAEKRLQQTEKANEILGSIFKDLNPREAENDGKPLAAVLGERLDQANAQIEGEAIGDALDGGADATDPRFIPTRAGPLPEGD